MEVFSWDESEVLFTISTVSRTLIPSVDWTKKMAHQVKKQNADLGDFYLDNISSLGGFGAVVALLLGKAPPE
jgi:hypothetical protein